MDDIYEMVDKAIDLAFKDDKFYFKCYNYLRQIKASPEFIERFKNSTTLKGVALMVSDLDAYLVDGDKQCTEAYGHLGTKKAEKIRNYLFRILNDTKAYESRYS